MTTYIPESLRREVIEREQDRCEYCRVHQHDRFFVHEIDHIYALFHPRRNRWSEHFRILDGILEPLTSNGRVTARLLHFNEPDAIDRRRSLIDSGHYPSS
jgi:5-methylcytosine-specific restriction endonuclease McrA